ncbi:hypothetical protein Ciccas_011065, partial [Cichlidogyrus casuarinus]
MHPDISRFSNKYFYRGLLVNGLKASDRKTTFNQVIFKNPSVPIIFNHHRWPESRHAKSTSYYNEYEGINIILHLK